MKISTRAGDRGETGLLHGRRVWKNTPRLDVCGTLDELNAVLGMVRAEELPAEVDALLEPVQHSLFNAGTELAAVLPDVSPCPTIGAEHIQAIERHIERIEAVLPPLENFILPGGTRAAAALHLAGTVCRRAERHLVALAQIEPNAVSPNMLAYINRLSDFFFILARFCNAQTGMADVYWKK
jgi:cob(I)alamin adenosyltransferase